MSPHPDLLAAGHTPESMQRLSEVSLVCTTLAFLSAAAALVSSFWDIELGLELAAAAAVLAVVGDRTSLSTRVRRVQEARRRLLRQRLQS